MVLFYSAITIQIVAFILSKMPTAVNIIIVSIIALVLIFHEFLSRIAIKYILKQNEISTKKSDQLHLDRIKEQQVYFLNELIKKDLN